MDGFIFLSLGCIIIFICGLLSARKQDQKLQKDKQRLLNNIVEYETYNRSDPIGYFIIKHTIKHENHLIDLYRLDTRISTTIIPYQSSNMRYTDMRSIDQSSTVYNDGHHTVYGHKTEFVQEGSHVTDLAQDLLKHDKLINFNGLRRNSLGQLEQKINSGDIISKFLVTNHKLDLNLE